jgi:hypothetical protein
MLYILARPDTPQAPLQWIDLSAMAPRIRLRTLRRGGDLHVDTECSEVLPPFPSPPQGVDRRKHLPTIEAAIVYWEAVSRYAWDVGDDSLLETAKGLKESYEDARAELSKVEEQPPTTKRKTARGSRKARPSG